MAKKSKPKSKPKRKTSKPTAARKGRGKPPTDPNKFAKWLVDRTTA